MKILLIVLIFFNLSCSFNSKINNKSSQLKDNSYYFKSPSIDDFLSKINEYTEVSEYPNLEN